MYWISSATAPSVISSPAATRAVRRPEAGAHGLQVALDHVGHRLDDVVVDPRRRLVDAGGDGEQPAVLDALGDQPGLRRELAALAR